MIVDITQLRIGRTHTVWLERLMVRGVLWWLVTHDFGVCVDGFGTVWFLFRCFRDVSGLVLLFLLMINVTFGFFFVNDM